MAIAFVQQNKAASASAAAFTSNTTTGNLIIACLWTNGNVYNPVNNVSDTTNTYLHAGGPSFGGNGALDVWYAPNITGATTPTVTATINPQITRLGAFTNLFILEVSGLATGQPLDYCEWAQMKPPSTTVQITLGTSQPRTPNNFVFFAAGQQGFSQTFTVGSGWSSIQQAGTSTTGGTAATQIQINTSAANINGIMGGPSTSAFAPVVICVFSDTNLPTPKTPTIINNFQSIAIEDNGNAVMSIGEKIR